MANSGLQGLIIVKQQLGSPIGGFFGFTVQISTNLLLKVTDEQDQDISNIQVSYVSGAETISFTSSGTKAYQQLSIPSGVSTTITLSKAGYNNVVFTVLIATGDMLTLTKKMSLGVVPYQITLRRKL